MLIKLIFMLIFLAMTYQKHVRYTILVMYKARLRKHKMMEKRNEIVILRRIFRITCADASGILALQCHTVP